MLVLMKKFFLPTTKIILFEIKNTILDLLEIKFKCCLKLIQGPRIAVFEDKT